MVQFSPDFDNIKIRKQAQELILHSFDVFFFFFGNVEKTPDSYNYRLSSDQMQGNTLDQSQISAYKQLLTHAHIYTQYSMSVSAMLACLWTVGGKPTQTCAAKAVSHRGTKSFKLLQHMQIQSHCALVEMNTLISASLERAGFYTSPRDGYYL